MKYVELFGYFSSFIILVSLMMNSIKKLRWINCIGAFMFSIYGVLVGSIPTTFLNLGIVIINFYYLFKLHSSSKEV